MTRSLITLTTDFGAESVYVAQLKGAILSRAPEVHLLDLSHGIPPQNVRAAARFLAKATPFFPSGSIHLSVVDPGVGTDRPLLYAAIRGQHFLAPDNGILSLLIPPDSPQPVIVLSRPEFWSPRVSSTFHGRDILAPIAAYLACGGDPRSLGEPAALQVRLPFPQPTIREGQVVGEVVEVDSFGNLITNLRPIHLDQFSVGDRRANPIAPGPVNLSIHCGEHTLHGLVRTYHERPKGALVALFGSSDELELSLVEGNAAVALKSGVGTLVIVNRSE